MLINEGQSNQAPKMLFKIHYFSFNAGLSGVSNFIAVFLRKFSDASSTEVGTLLMLLCFVSAFVARPLVCALAHRHRKYRLYLILALFFTLLGFGAYALLPFHPELVAAHGRACWHFLAAATLIGYIAHELVRSLGDACASNVARPIGDSFGATRLWGTIGWGAAGACVAAISPHLALPEMVPGLMLFMAALVFEILLLAWWPNGRDFEMGAGLAARHEGATGADLARALGQVATITEKPAAEQRVSNEAQKREPELLCAIDLGGQLKSTAGSLQICRTASNSLAIVTRLKLDSSAASALDQLAAPKFAPLNHTNLAALVAANCKLDGAESAPGGGAQLVARAEAEAERQRLADLQPAIFKTVAVRHKSLLKYLLIFVALGTLHNLHWSYFFLHLEQLAGDERTGTDFATLVGLCLVAQALGETFCVALAPWLVRKLGRDGAISLSAATFALRFFGNALGIPLVSPRVAILTESLQGMNYGLLSHLIGDIALHFALLVDDAIPELEARGLLAKRANLDAVRVSLRATVGRVFSGAFEGLGFGLGSLLAGLLLERHSYEQLWCYAGQAALALFCLHGLYELTNRAVRRRLDDISSYKREIKRINKATLK